MICECGNILNENAIFCSQCGKKVEKQEKPLFCTNCGSKVKSDAVFCDSCGNRVNLNDEAIIDNDTHLIMSMDSVALYKGKRPIGTLNVYGDKVEFVYSGHSAVGSAYKNALFLGGAIGGLVAGIADEKNASKGLEKPAVVDTFTMGEIAIANKGKVLGVSCIEIALKNGNKMKYIDNSGKVRVEQMISLVDAINTKLLLYRR